MPEPPPRKRLQIHLSTAIVMMFVAGGVISLNVIPDVTVVTLGDLKTVQVLRYGWPNIAAAPRYDGKESIQWWAVSYSAFFINIAAAFTILASVWYLCEWIIRRRRAARKEV